MSTVSAAGSKIADLLIEDEKIVRVGQNRSCHPSYMLQSGC